jgi:hypothetical protein
LGSEIILILAKEDIEYYALQYTFNDFKIGKCVKIDNNYYDIQKNNTLILGLPFGSTPPCKTKEELKLITKQAIQKEFDSSIAALESALARMEDF